MADLLELLGAAVTGGTALATISVTEVTTADTFLADSATGGIGYKAGAGATVTQGTNKTTGVTLNNVCGTITTHAASLGAGAEASFTVTNSNVAATDIPIPCIRSGPATPGTYAVSVSAVAAGSFVLTLTNLSDGALAEAVVISFGLLKVVAA